MKILRELRERAGLTLRQVEESVSISNAYLSQLETGKIKKPSAQAMYVLAKFYGVEVENLLIEAGLVVKKNIIPVPVRATIEHRLDELEKRVSKLEEPRFEDLRFID